MGIPMIKFTILLFDLSTDISERLNIAGEHPEIVTRIQEEVERHQKTLRTESESQ